MSLVDQAHTTPERVTDMPEQRRRSYSGSSSDSCSPPASEASPTSDTYDHDIIDRYRADMMNSGPIKPSTRAPALPMKSARRVSRFLDTTITPISRPQSKTRSNPIATPYDVYLSSEEDASSSADDFSDFDLDSDSEENKKHHGYSIVITARVVSVIFSGKPSIIELPCRARKSGSSAGHLTRAETEPILTRRLSTTSSASSVTLSHPPRLSSRMPNSIERSHRPTFLNTDPFASKAGEEIERPATPLTPSVMFKRGLSLVKKRSRHQLSPDGFYSHSKENISVQTLPVDPEEERQSRQMVGSPLEAKSPGSYQEMMRTARWKAFGLQESDSASVISSNTANLSKLRAGFALGRRRSIKA
ncbi:hypothetical protein NLU13_9318 [Sarocladium strictum]|uniref:Uncharacterized protein n=1 Tax=Sarocladium strictum TaxID=5046 RepID=A0AA39GA92_SARSR|nr:hypothetical protein NLU13_9318 [Sarocladium strictum]